MNQDQLLSQIINEYLTQYMSRTGNRPTAEVINNVTQFVHRDAQEALSKGMSYEDYYVKAFRDAANRPGNLNKDARAAGQAYELMSSQKLRGMAAGMLSGAGRGQVNPPNIDPNLYGGGNIPNAGRGYGDINDPLQMNPVYRNMAGGH